MITDPRVLALQIDRCNEQIATLTIERDRLLALQAAP